MFASLLLLYIFFKGLSTLNPIVEISLVRTTKRQRVSKDLAVRSAAVCVSRRLTGLFGMMCMNVVF